MMPPHLLRQPFDIAGESPAHRVARVALWLKITHGLSVEELTVANLALLPESAFEFHASLIVWEIGKRYSRMGSGTPNSAAGWPKAQLESIALELDARGLTAAFAGHLWPVERSAE